MTTEPNVLDFSNLGLKDLEQVGGKNASLGELISQLSLSGIKVPHGFATTASAFNEFLNINQLKDKIDAKLQGLNANDIEQLQAVGSTIRQMVLEASLPERLIHEVTEAYQRLQTLAENQDEMTVAVRSSATAEDLPEASFAGQQESYLNVKGLDQVLEAIKHVFASLYNDRAISYRVHQGFAHESVALSAGVQLMVRSDLASSGVMFTIDTETGSDKLIFINSAYGLGELVVQGAVNPDEFYVYKENLNHDRPAILRKNLGSKQEKMIYSNVSQWNKSTDIVSVELDKQLEFSLTDEEIKTLAQYGLAIEKHYGRPMDIEWAKDGRDGQLYILQARPETVNSQSCEKSLVRYSLDHPDNQTVLVQGRAIGQKIGQGSVKIINNVNQIGDVNAGDVLVTDMTDPDWEPIMKKASAIVTNRGGRTCHAAIIAREMGIPAVVGCGNATQLLKNDEVVTVSCAQGDTGFIYAGRQEFSIHTVNIESMPSIPVKIMMNIANPERAFEFCNLPHNGVGLARLEFIISQMIRVHPQAILNYNQLPQIIQKEIKPLIQAYSSPEDYYVDRLTQGIATIAAAAAPHPAIIRCSDFKSNEYANLIGGAQFEPKEENPMLGYRGASRYLFKDFRDSFALECKAIRNIRLSMGLKNVQIMIPFVRTLEEAKQVIELLAEHDLKRGEDGLKLIMMCELPINALLANQFLEFFDGFSIGSNDLTQLTLGIDRDSGLVAEGFNEDNLAVKQLISMAIKACKQHNKYVGICGQGPSDNLSFAAWLVEQGIDTISLNPDTVIETWLTLAKEPLPIGSNI